MADDRGIRLEIQTARAGSAAGGIAVDSAGNVFFADTGDHLVREVNPSGQIVRVAGNQTNGFGGDGGPATAASLNSPMGVAIDAAGDLFIADTSNNRVREVAAGGGATIVTVAGNGATRFGGDNGPAAAAALDSPEGLAVDAAGDLFVADTRNQRIREVKADGTIRTVAGNGTAGYGGDGGLATAAQLNDPVAVAVDAAGNLFIADSTNNRIREVLASTGKIITVAGTGTAGYAGDGGDPTAAQLSDPSGVAVDPAGDLFIADTGNNRIREVVAGSGRITAYAGTGTGTFGGDGGPASAAELAEPQGLAVDGAGNLFIADWDNHRVREVVAATGRILTVAGNGYATFGGDGGPATAASLDYPQAVAIDRAGNLYIADRVNARVREVAKATGTIVTVAGNGSLTGADQVGPAVAAPLDPYGIAVDATGNLLIADGYNSRVSEVTPAAVTDVLARTSVSVTESSATEVYGQAVTFTATVDAIGAGGAAPDGGTVTFRDASTVLGVVPVISGIATLTTSTLSAGSHAVSVEYSGDGSRFAPGSSGTVATVAGGSNADDGLPAASARFDDPGGLAVDALGDLFIADSGTNRVRELVKATGLVVTVAGTGVQGSDGDGGPAGAALLNNPSAVALDAAGDLFIADTGNNRIREVVAATGQIFTVAGTGTAGFGGDGAAATLAMLNGPLGIAVDAAGDLFIADTGNNRVREVVGTTGQIVTVAGTGTAGFGGDGAAATGAMLSGPLGLVVDPAGNLFIADSGNNRVRRVDAASKTITTYAGNGAIGSSGDGGPAAAAQLNGPQGLALDAAGDLFIADYSNDRVREVTRDGAIRTVAGTGTQGFAGSGGPATSAQLGGPKGVAIDRSGILSIADVYGDQFDPASQSRIAQVSGYTGAISTVSAIGYAKSGSFRGDNGPAIDAGLSFPFSGASDAAGDLFFIDAGNTRVREIVKATGQIVTVAGNGASGYAGDGGPATSAQFNNPAGVAVDAAGNLFIADSGNNRVREVGRDGTITTVAGTWTAGYGGDNGPATAAELSDPNGVAVDASGDLYIADYGNQRVREVVKSTGQIITVAGTGAVGYSGDGGPATAAKLAYPTAVAVDAAGDLFIGDASNDRVREVRSNGTILTVAGNGGFGESGDGGPATAAQLGSVYGLGVDAAGDLFLATSDNVGREVLAATGTIVTVAGNGTPGYSGDGGPATAAEFDGTLGLAVGPGGELWVADAHNNRVREVGTSATTLVTAAATQTAITTSTVTAVYGQPVTFTATVNAVAPSTATPTGGTVTFLDGSTVIGTTPLVGGVALFTTSSLGTTTHAITASYGGDGLEFSPSSAGTITTIAGSGPGPLGVAPTSVSLAAPENVAVDQAGNLYIADSGGNRVWELVAATGRLVVVAGNGTSGFSGDGGLAADAALSDPRGIALDSAGNVFIADSGNSRVREVLKASDQIITVAGNGATSYNGDHISATSASLSTPQGLAVDAAGDLFIADTINNRVREVVNGQISTVAGNGTAGYGGDNGPATAAAMYYPDAVAVDAAGDLFISDSWNIRIREVVNGQISTIAGDGKSGYAGDNGPATAAYLSSPRGVAVDKAGNVFIADAQNNRIREVVKSSGQIVTVAGNGTAGYSGDNGAAVSALLAYPTGVAVDAAGNLFIADTDNSRVREVVNGQIATVAGNGLHGDSADGGRADASLLSGPSGVAFDAAGNLFIADSGSNRVREVVRATGSIVTVAGNGQSGESGDGGPATAASLWGPTGVAIDKTGNLFIADYNDNRIREVVAATGNIITLAGTGTYGFGGDGGPATAAQLSSPEGVTVDSAGNLFIADSGNNRIREVVAATGRIITVAGTGTAGFGGDNGPASAAQFYNPESLTLDSNGNLFIADSYNYRIREVVATTGNIITVAGNGQSGNSGDNGPAAGAELYAPGSVTLDAAGDLFIADTWNNRIREVVKATGNIISIAGNGNAGFTGDGGLATAAALQHPAGVAVDAAGEVFFSDRYNNRIRRFSPAAIINVTAVTTATSVTASSSSPVYGQPLTFTATVSANAPSVAAPTGTVQFQVDGANFGTPATLVNGVATSPSINSLTLGNHTVLAIYTNADGNFVGGSGSIGGGVTIAPAATATSVTASSTSPVYGQPEAFTATVTAKAPSAATPTGTVQFQVDGTNFGAPVPLVNGSAASPSISNLGQGMHVVQAYFTNTDGDFSGGNGTLSGGLTVAAAATTTSVSASAASPTFGQPVSFTATVAANSPSQAVPSGSVQFQVDGANFGAPVALVNGSATSQSASNLAVGNHTVQAVYVADSKNFNGSSGSLAGGESIAPTPVPAIADNGGPGYAQTGTWTAANGYGGYGNNYLYAAPASGSATATAAWTTGGLAAGYYDVQATWGAGSNRASNAPYQVYDGNTLLGTVAVNQKVAPSGAAGGGVAFQSLGVFKVTSGTLRVVLSNNANGYVVADAIRIAAPTAVPAVADDGGAGYSEAGAWTAATGFGGYGNAYQYAAPSTAAATATASWTTNGIAPGYYDVQVTWGAGSNRATNAPYQVYDGNTLLGTVAVNQKLAPSGTTAGGVAFQSLGVFNVTSGTLRVVLGNNANGYVVADAVRIAPPTAVPAIADNAGAGYAQAGSWVAANGYGGYNNNYVYAAPTTGSATATASWTTNGVAPGYYDVQVTWGAGSNRASNAPYQVYDGNTLLSTIAVNQKLAPSGPTAGGVAFQSLGVFHVTSGTLRVVLGNNANGYVIADAMRIAAPAPVSTTTDNGGAGYSQTGTWTTASGYGGYNNNYAYAAPVTGNATATAAWTTTGLVPGSYDVQVTWGAGSNRATNATYQVYDGNTLLGTVVVNQKLAPSGATSGGVVFQSLGIFNVTSGTLRVVLGNNANGYVVADAVHIASAQS